MEMSSWEAAYQAQMVNVYALTFGLFTLGAVLLLAWLAMPRTIPAHRRLAADFIFVVSLFIVVVTFTIMAVRPA